MYTIKVVLFFTLVLGVFGAKKPLIVGGDDADIGQFPHAVSLQYNGRHFCGGSVVGPNWILTAGHCGDPFRNNANQVRALVGTVSLSSGGTYYNITDIVIHPGYTANIILIKNDVALFKVSPPIQYNHNVKAIDLCIKTPRLRANAVVSGWGLLQGGSSDIPDHLQFLNTTIISDFNCYIQNFPTITLYKQICAQAARNAGVCNGDSGSALVYEGSQCGIVSWGKGCAAGRPDVYADVCEYKSWILSNMEAN